MAEIAGVARIVGIVRRATRAVALVGGVMLLVTVAMVVLEIGLRKLAGTSLSGVHELSGYMLALVATWSFAYALAEQAHVRIDLLRDGFPLKIKYLVELVGIGLFLFTYSLLGAWYTYKYALASFLEHEMSKSTIGLSHIWIVKSALVAMFILMGLAAISQFIKALAGFRGVLPDEMVAETLGGDN